MSVTKLTVSGVGEITGVNDFRAKDSGDQLTQYFVAFLGAEAKIMHREEYGEVMDEGQQVRVTAGYSDDGRLIRPKLERINAGGVTMGNSPDPLPASSRKASLFKGAG